MMSIWKVDLHDAWCHRHAKARASSPQFRHQLTQQLRTARSSHHQAPFGGGGKRAFPRDATLSVSLGGGGYFGGHSHMSVNGESVFPAITTQFAADQSLDLPATAKRLETLIQAGIHGVVLL